MSNWLPLAAFGGAFVGSSVPGVVILRRDMRRKRAEREKQIAAMSEHFNKGVFDGGTTPSG